MTRIFRLLFVTILLLGTLSASAQQFLWDVTLDSRFDNREYDTPLCKNQTLFGARLTPEVGLGWGMGNMIKAGVDVGADFGDRISNGRIEPIVYYGYNSNKFNAYVGIFPRKHMMGGYSSAFFCDSVDFYDANLEGVLLQYVGKRGYVEFGCDWNSRIGKDAREKFMLMSSARFNTKLFYMGYNLSLYHHAATSQLPGVVDNVLVNPFLGLDLSRIMPLDTVTLQVGYMQAMQNDRKYVGEYVTPHGVQIELQFQKYRFGIYNTLYLGDNLMPYYATTESGNPSYGNGLYYGDPFYRTESGVYNRLEVYWQPISHKGMNLRIASVHHFDGDAWHWQQMIKFAVNIGDKSFKKKGAK